MKKFLVAALTLLSTAAFADTVQVTGAGATFPAPLYTKWFSDYNQLHPDVQINYQAIGSGGGIRQFTEKTVDFGASDAPMTEKELAKAPDAVHIPTVLGAVVVVFNVQGVDQLKLSPSTLAGIFLGTINKWNDKAIAQDNPGATLPDQAIAVAHRADGSGTTAIFTEYLAKVSPEWKHKVGEGKSVKWPVGLGGNGNDGVTGLVKQNPGSIGYVELAYANQNKLTMAQLKNHDGQWVKPSLDGVSAAAAGVQMPEDFRVSITDAAGKTSYPISAFTYLLVHKNQDDAAKGNAVLQFIHWAETDGQKLAPALDYGALPQSVQQKVLAKLNTLTVAGKPFHAAK